VDRLGQREQVHRVEVGLHREVDGGVDLAQVDLGGDVGECIGDDLAGGSGVHGVLLERFGVVEGLDDGREQQAAGVAVGRAVIARHGEADGGSDHGLAVDRQDAVGDATHAHQRHLRRLDHTDHLLGALVAEVGDGDRGGGEVGAAQSRLAVTG
jgi:hypothetical protein